MRAALFASVSLSLLAPAAFADGEASAPVSTTIAATTAPVLLEDPPERCAALAKRTQVAIAAQAMTARIALAGCVANARMEPLQLIDGQESVLAIEEATAPSFAMLDGVVDRAEAPTKIMALRAKADLYGQMRMRMMNTVPAPANTTPEAAALRETRRQIVEGMVVPWRERAREAHQAIVDFGRKHPELVKNPVVQTAIRDSERQLAQLTQVANS